MLGVGVGVGVRKEENVGISSQPGDLTDVRLSRDEAGAETKR